MIQINEITYKKGNKFVQNINLQIFRFFSGYDDDTCDERNIEKFKEKYISPCANIEGKMFFSLSGMFWPQVFYLV